MTYTSYERIKAALEHREPDRVPFDLGGTVLTGMNTVAYRNLRKYLGLPEVEVQTYDTKQQLARIDQDVLDRLMVDVRCVDPGQAQTPLATPVRREGDYHCYQDQWGITWRMPVQDGLYFDMYKHPLADAESVADLEKYPWPDPEDPERFATMKQRADRFVHEEKKAYVLGRHAAGLFEVSLWLRGFENFLVDMAANPGFAHALLDIVTDLKMRYWKKALETVGENVLIVSEADDIATQRGPIMSMAMYREFIAPRHRRLFEHIRSSAKSRVYIFFHSCGAVKDLIPQLIDEGIDILNPVQVSAEGMDTRELKRLYGRDITFWGGGVDTQRVLPYGTPRQVRDEVRRRIDDLAPGGGFVFNPVHNVQGDVPPENYMAMWETLCEYGVYAS
ncbi:MAG TPA: uroporphyrinogen decarboxylase family protein [Phycisphaerae bacterium]|nr:uroporphyrinogen decarboxylase family protein [Phycisphaerae bacterium]HRR83756.1 uroporphyrinogen decarboxylase family protein [Phycisphaerae bacterium]